MAVDAFIKFINGDGTTIDGESNDSKHKNEIEILSYSFGIENRTNVGGGGTGGGSGKASFHEFHFVSHLQKSSPVLFLKCATGEHIKQGIISVRKSGGGRDDYLKITLSDVLVSSLDQSVAADDRDDFPSEEMSLNFQKIRWEYTVQNNKGAVGDTIVAEWPPTAGVP